jgi:hypothetical protein
VALFAALGCGDEGDTIIIVRGSSGGAGAGGGGTSGDDGGANSAGGSDAGKGGSSVSAGGSTSGGKASGGDGGSDSAGTNSSGGLARAGGSNGGGGAAGSGSASGTELFFDDFEDGNKDGWVDGLGDDSEPFGTWTVVAGGTSSVYHVETPPSFTSWAIGGNVNWTDIKVEADFRFVAPASADTAVFLVAVRFQDLENHYRMRYRAGEARLTVYADVDSAPDTQPVPVIPIGTSVKLTVIAQGSTLSGFIDDVQVLSGTDMQLTSGGIALAVANGAGEFDNVRVTVP